MDPKIGTGRGAIRRSCSSAFSITCSHRNLGKRQDASDIGAVHTEAADDLGGVELLFDLETADFGNLRPHGRLPTLVFALGDVASEGVRLVSSA